LVIFVEEVFINYVLPKTIIPIWKKLTGMVTKEEKFLAVERELTAERWPPVTRELPIKLNASISEMRSHAQPLEVQMMVVGDSSGALARHELTDHAL
jgi:hypothetical protein